MKTRILITALCAAGLLAAAGTASAGGNATLGVSATVNGTCKVTDGTGQITFAAVDPDVGANQTANNSTDMITFWCTRKANYTVTDNGGQNGTGAPVQRRMVLTGDSTEFLPYGLTYTSSGQGSGPSTFINLTVTATVSSTDLASAAAGEFTDTVLFTIAP